ncbi:MAG: chorismate mutase [Planctomycetota bacterium]|nr:MAG: chorismate mutase [Planctomycetota bacterium]REJ87466.1 MAG: chorismate mutase [Planctomycetota bacterium]REK24434.1 MAG: chorismate mutase [Planctomycetota bacterium]REK38623.1 MAG: chorismate mutase [Planctomycetota bacterium]
MPVRGIRGAVNADDNTAQSILEATRELLQEIIRANSLDCFDDIVSAVFTTTQDLDAAFPAEAARELGMHRVPLLCATEINVPGSMRHCIRILLHVNTDRNAAEMVHVYLKDAARLRPDMKSAQ